MITRYTSQANFALGACRSYRALGYSRHLSRKLARWIIADARAGVELQRY
jgi:hypothetical protein